MRKFRAKTFYELKNCVDTSIIGRQYPQCQTVQKGVDAHMSTSFYPFYKFARIPDCYPNFIPQLDGMELRRSAKLTDFISSIYLYRPVVNKRAIHVLTFLNYGSHRIYPLTIVTKWGNKKYYYIYMLNYGKFSVIWDKTKFYSTELALRTKDIDSIYEKRTSRGLIQFSNHENFIDNYELSPNIEELGVDSRFSMNLDLINISYLNEYIVSERFIDVYHKSNLTGLEFGRPIRVIQYK